MLPDIEEICAELVRQPDEAARRRSLARFPHLIGEETIRQLAEAVRVAVRVDVRKAFHLADVALTIADELKSDEALALALRAKANALWFMGDCKSAVHLFDQASALFERIGNKNELARTLSSSIQSLALLGEYEKASAAAARARDIFTNLGETWRVARVDINIANVYHRQNRYAEALAAYEQAYRQLLPHKDMEGIGVSLHNMSVCLMALDDFPKALETYGRVRDFCREQEMPLLVAQADYNVAYLYYLRGDYTRALELLRSTSDTFHQNGDIYHVGLCDLDRSEIYLELNFVGEAAAMAQSSVEHFEHLGMKFETARALTNFAIAVSIQCDTGRALELFTRAKSLFEDEKNRVWPNLIDLYRALSLFERNEFAEARLLCLSASDFFHAAHMPSKHVTCLLLLTRIALQTGEIDDAAQWCEHALHILKNLDAPLSSYEAHLLRGNVHKALARTDDAYGCYQQARHFLELLRSSLQRQELKTGFMRNRMEVYDRLIQLCLNRHPENSSAEEVLFYVEAAKSRTLRDVIFSGNQPTLHKTESTDADRQVRDLRNELNWYYHRIELEQLSKEGAPSETVEPLRAQATARENQLLRLLLDSSETASVGAALKNSRTATVEEIRNALGPETALLEYFAIDNRVYVAVLTAGSLKIVSAGSTEDLSQRLKMLQFQMSKFGLGADYVNRHFEALVRSAQAHLSALYQDLLFPVESMLEVRDLVIVPFGPLHALPFHALFDGRRYLLDRFNICYEPSASIFAHLHQVADVGSGQSLIVGVDDERTPYIREEVAAVSAVVPEPRVLFGPAATEQALREQGATSRLIHIASHGYFRQDSPMFSSIRLADSYLNLYDLYHMNLPANLLTLSGCVTGLNVVTGGDELVGLTRGLLYAGARALLLSLWDVDDRSTADFMVEFYSRLNEQPRRADALRTAMVNLRERYPHPYHWAPFKIIGKALN